MLCLEVGKVSNIKSSLDDIRKRKKAAPKHKKNEATKIPPPMTPITSVERKELKDRVSTFF